MVDFCGIQLNNALIASSATPTISPENLRRLAQAGAGAAVTKSVVFGKSPAAGVPPRRYGNNPRPRFCLLNSGLKYDPAITSSGGYFTLLRYGELYPTPEEYAEGIARVKKEIDMPIIASICGAPYEYEGWRKLAEMMQDAGSDALELNMHCIPKIKYNQTDVRIVQEVSSVAKIPIIVKLMADWEDPYDVGPKVVEAGADAITAIGTFGRPVLEVDAEKEEFFFQSSFGGMGGTWYRPVGLAWIARLAKAVDVPLSGVTGIASWEDAVKYILVGATTVQICAALYARGYSLIRQIQEGIEQFMQRHGYQRIEDFRGKLLDKLCSPGDLPFSPPIKARIDRDKCIGCEKCVDSCFFSAIAMDDGKAVVDEGACDGCGVCTSICPVQAASMVSSA